MSDERLNQLAGRFLGRKIGTLLNITFAAYIEHPEYYDELVDALDSGHGLQMSEAGELLAVEINGIM